MKRILFLLLLITNLANGQLIGVRRVKPVDGGAVERATQFVTIDQLRAGVADTARAVYVTDAGKSGIFVYQPGYTGSDDSSMVITSGSRKYVRDESIVDVRRFGAVADYNYATNTGTDNTAAFQKAINSILNGTGGTLYIPPGRYFFSGSIYINSLATPLKIIGGNGNNRNYSANKIVGTSLIKNNAGSLFRINQKADGSAFLASNEQYPSLHVQGINFQCKNSYAGGVNVFYGFRFTGKFEDISCDGFDYFMYQPNTDVNNVDNYCDKSTYRNIRISGSTLGGLRLFASDRTSIEGIDFEGSATQYKYGIEVYATDAIRISDVLFWTPNDVTPLSGANFIHLVASNGVTISNLHLERSFFNNFFYVESCTGVSIHEVTTKFFRYTGLYVTGTSYGVSIKNWKSNDLVKAGSYDINVPGSSDKQVIYENCLFLDNYNGVERSANINFPTKTTVRTPAYIQSYQGSTDASITMVRGSMTMFLAAITANRTLTVPTVAQSINGDKITIVNRNTSAFRWLVGNTVLDADGTSLTYFENNKTYDLIFANGQWRVQTKYPEFTTITTTASGNGSATTISIAHGMASTPSYFTAQANNAAASGISHVTADATNINIVYGAAPASGTNNLSYTISYKR